MNNIMKIETGLFTAGCIEYVPGGETLFIIKSV